MILLDRCLHRAIELTLIVIASAWAPQKIAVYSNCIQETHRARLGGIAPGHIPFILDLRVHGDTKRAIGAWGRRLRAGGTRPAPPRSRPGACLRLRVGDRAGQGFGAGGHSG
jgi:hypothetical protein